jgi:hypothetical protein
MTPTPHDDDLDDDDPVDLYAALAELREIDKETAALILFLENVLDQRHGAMPASSKPH